ncbi:hypothetical protein TRB37_149 [Escherichia phage vB_Eco_TB37]
MLKIFCNKFFTKLFTRGFSSDTITLSKQM